MLGGATVHVANNAIQFWNVPGVNAAFTLGNVQIYGAQNPGNTNQYPSYTGNVDLGLHEEGHTFQAQALGSVIFPLAGVFGGGPTAENLLERGADAYARGESCNGL